ncbi:hypothetical protein E2562_033773 [Oryza meyeriana var. granulata]|uniref:Glycosyltransferases n=1 Tax=Oryza meyeriana var. granulata TaxID=110450 RepID=A0A6G1F135_9ORYZ|nr:hypothetical protein E2562_033773 [Oryza meyeriana var. granulata]KAF0930610.1 hypothetical protein E2562_033773 [Oryza meyeriana var. granulata]
MSGFAFNSSMLWDAKNRGHQAWNYIRQLDTAKEGFQETTFIEQLVEDETHMEGVPPGSLSMWLKRNAICQAAVAPPRHRRPPRLLVVPSTHASGRSPAPPVPHRHVAVAPPCRRRPPRFLDVPYYEILAQGSLLTRGTEEAS